MATKIHHDTPSEQIIKAANQTDTVTDARGRQLAIRKIGALDRMKMFEVCGPENSKNEAYLGYAALAFSVAKIDDEDLPRIDNKLRLEARIDRLGDEGLDAVGAFFQAEAKVKKQADAETEKQQLKNSSGTPS